MSKRWQRGSTAAWRRVRALVLARDCGRCQLRLPGCTTLATHVHHTSARELVGDDPAYLVAACKPCNLSTGDPIQHDPDPRPRTNWGAGGGRT